MTRGNCPKCLGETLWLDEAERLALGRPGVPVSDRSRGITAISDLSRDGPSLAHRQSCCETDADQLLADTFEKARGLFSGWNVRLLPEYVLVADN